jgi:hypothetical protein
MSCNDKQTIARGVTLRPFKAEVKDLVKDRKDLWLPLCDHERKPRQPKSQA